jgi:hypothetical protein
MSDGGRTANDDLGVAESGAKAFIDRWQRSAASERANYQLFLSELCDVLNVSRPNPAGPDHAKNAYVFERGVVFHHGDGTQTTGSIDLYKRECFVLEAKQGSVQKSAADLPLFGGLGEKPVRWKRGTAVRGTKGWDDAMVLARGQAEAYAKALPIEEGWPPFLIVVDVATSSSCSPTSRAPANTTRSFRTRPRSASRSMRSAVAKSGRCCGRCGRSRCLSIRPAARRA